MSDPQIENGNYARTHNEILEALARVKLTGREASCIFFLLRKTYGWNKKQDAISLNQWVEGTGIGRRHIKEILDKLVERKIFKRSDSAIGGRGNITVYGLNKYSETWDKRVPSTVPLERVPSTVPERVPSTVPTINKRQTAASRPPFVDAFEHFTGRLIANPYEAERITDWETRVTLEGWQAALEKTARKRPANFWGYIETILRDYEQNGFSAKVTPKQTTTVEFTIEEIL